MGALIADADTKNKSLYQDIDEGFKSDAAALLDEVDIRLVKHTNQPMIGGSNGEY